MSEMSQNAPFSLLPDRRPPWKEFVLTMGVQGLALFVLVWAASVEPGGFGPAGPRLSLHSIGRDSASGDP